MNQPWVLHTLDVVFFVFHTTLIAFNLTGWAWRRTRRANLLCLLLTLASWTLLGIWYGMGYCPCTDWHWQVRDALGYPPMPPSYVQFLIHTFTGLQPDAVLVDYAAVTGLGAALAVSLALNIRDWRRAGKYARA